MSGSQSKLTWKKIWYFIWEDNSIWSWIVNVLLAFILIKFLVYPGLGFLLGTTHPVVAVVSESMEHDVRFDAWWDENGQWYENQGIAKESFESYALKNGFNKGDIMFLSGKEPYEIEIGDVIVFISHRTNPRADPIIHRVTDIRTEDDQLIFQTRGDNNPSQINSCDQYGCIDETRILGDQIIGTAKIRIPWLGYIKIGFVYLLQALHIL